MSYIYIGRNLVSKHQIQPEYGDEQTEAGRDPTELVSRYQILRHARGQGNIHFPCSADHEQDWQPYLVDPYSAICDDHTYIYILHIYIYIVKKNLSSCNCIGIRTHVPRFRSYQLNHGGDRRHISYSCTIAVSSSNGEDVVRFPLSGWCLKKNMNASRPSDHPPVRGENIRTFSCFTL